MKLGLVRHFKVDLNTYKGIHTPTEINEIMRQYDNAPVISNNLKLNKNDWDICFCSSLPRAIFTAKEICGEEVIPTDLLIEVPIAAFTKKEIRLRSVTWHVGARVAWYFNHRSQIEKRNETKQRVKLVYEMILNSKKENVLIVSHGFFLKVFTNFLMKNGFRGKIDTEPRNGKLYLFEK